MIVRTRRGTDVVFNEDQIVRVAVEDGGLKVELTYVYGKPESLGPTSYVDEDFVPNLLEQLVKTEKFSPLGKGYQDLPAEYVNLSLVRRSELTKEIAFLVFPNGETREYRGKDRETINLRLIARAGP